MIHQSPPTKFHQNPLTHLLNLHSTVTNNTQTTVSPSSNIAQDQQLRFQNIIEKTTQDYHNHHHHHIHHQQHQQTLDSVNEQIGKSFTIAAILGLKKNVAAVAAAAAATGATNGILNTTEHNNNNNINNNSSSNSFGDVMNLSLNHGGNGKFDINRLGQNYNTQMHHSNTSSALQSLQQLHQHHTNSAFHTREKQRDSNKKTSLKSKRVRTIFTPEQLERLEAEFERQQYMVGPERLYLAHSLQLTEAQVKVWFQNRRIKWRKHHLEITHQRLALLRQRQIPGTNENNRMNDSELTICTDSMDTSSSPDVEDNS